MDKYLAGCKALLLNTAGRAVLVNAVLSSLPTYLMGAMILPPGVRDAIDAKRRAFLWIGSDRATGAQCLVAWEQVCAMKEDGGLGIRRLDTQNAALLLKLLHRMHHPGGSAWANWVATKISTHDLSGDLDGEHWQALRQLLPAYQRITTVEVGDGLSTDFWNDNWIGDATLAELAPALHSHVVVTTPSVRDVVHSVLRSMFQRRLTPQALSELEHVESLIEDISLTDNRDKRSCYYEDNMGKLSSGLIYKTSTRGDQSCPSFHFVW